jgi:hypothetical protein
MLISVCAMTYYNNSYCVLSTYISPLIPDITGILCTVGDPFRAWSVYIAFIHVQV